MYLKWNWKLKQKKNFNVDNDRWWFFFIEATKNEMKWKRVEEKKTDIICDEYTNLWQKNFYLPKKKYLKIAAT